MYPEFDTINFDNPVKIYGIHDSHTVEKINEIIIPDKSPLISYYHLCPDFIIMFFRDLAIKCQPKILKSTIEDSICICFNLSDCLDRFMEMYKNSGNDEFDDLAQKTIELVILNKKINHIVLVT